MSTTATTNLRPARRYEAEAYLAGHRTFPGAVETDEDLLIPVENLNDLMEFDHVIEVREDGVIIERNDLFAPALLDGEVESGWTLMNGYSGQDRYSGPIMHDSEFIGGGMERDIRETPGVYVALVSYYLSEDGVEDDDQDGPYVEGWAVAVKDES